MPDTSRAVPLCGSAAAACRDAHSAAGAAPPPGTRPCIRRCGGCSINRCRKWPWASGSSDVKPNRVLLPQIPAKKAAAVDDAEISDMVSAAAKGDGAAWDALVQRFGGLVWSVTRAYRLSPADSADVFQTTLASSSARRACSAARTRSAETSSSAFPPSPGPTRPAPGFAPLPRRITGRAATALPS
jgi:hypothetical protein